MIFLLVALLSVASWLILEVKKNANKAYDHHRKMVLFYSFFMVLSIGLKLVQANSLLLYKLNDGLLMSSIAEVILLT